MYARGSEIVRSIQLLTYRPRLGLRNKRAMVDIQDTKCHQSNFSGASESVQRCRFAEPFYYDARPDNRVSNIFHFLTEADQIEKRSRARI